MKALEYAADATADIEAIWDYTYDRWGLEKAVTYDAALEVRIRGLLTGHTASREDETRVTVVRVLHQRMDVGRV
mgnify:CR=1 FL=1